MKKRFLTEKNLPAFAAHLKREEKSANTIEKYLRDVRAFASYTNKSPITKETVIAYKDRQRTPPTHGTNAAYHLKISTKKLLVKAEMT